MKPYPFSFRNDRNPCKFQFVDMFSRTSNDQKPPDMFLEAKVRTGSRPMEKFQYAVEGHEYPDGSLVPCRISRETHSSRVVTKELLLLD